MVLIKHDIVWLDGSDSMREVVLYIAMSLDGYIADEKGQVSFLKGDGSDPTHEGSYHSFLASIDTVVMGYRTYSQIVSELSPHKWPYEGLKSYVITHRDIDDQSQIVFHGQGIKQLIEQLKKEEGKDIWICGGANLVRQLMDLDLIDTYHITIMPTLIGQGVRLFQLEDVQKRLKLESTASYNGMVDIVYKKA